MADRNPSVSQRLSGPGSHGMTGWSANLELADRVTIGTGHERLHTQIRRRQINDRAVIENPLAHLADEDLADDVRYFAQTCLPSVDTDKLLRAARVAKDIRTYDDVARSDAPDAGWGLPVQLTDAEKRALKREKDVLFSERGMLIVILTVSLAAFLQGHVQSSINGASLYRDLMKLGDGKSSTGSSASKSITSVTANDWKLGAANASPFLFAAVLGCPLALPINDLVGRRGAMVVAAILILASSVGAAFVRDPWQLFGVRLINGIGMGIKAVSTPILASETAVGFWRGSSILAWQLWVAFGMMIGFVFNLIFTAASSEDTTLGLILGAPCVPALILLVALVFCPESPRYYMRPNSPNYNPSKAYTILLRLRNTELQALRDVYLVYKSIEQEEYVDDYVAATPATLRQRGFLYKAVEFITQYKQLLTERRLRNAVISSSTVNLAQQLCGINVLAFYSGTLFTHGGADKKSAMIYSFGFGCTNFFFGLPAIRTIDTLGRRKWLTMTLPLMCLFMAAAALSFFIDVEDTKIGIVAMWLYLFSAAYSPGLGPIPFTLASESFPLSHRESGCAFAISVNLLFAGLLSIFFPSMISNLGDGGCLGLFAGLNLLAFALVFLLVEETKRRSLEDLDWIFAVPKRTFVRYQVQTYLPWFFRRYLMGKKDDKPSLYEDKIWGKAFKDEQDRKASAVRSEATQVENTDNVYDEPGGPRDLDAQSDVDSLHA